MENGNKKACCDFCNNEALFIRKIINNKRKFLNKVCLSCKEKTVIQAHEKLYFADFNGVKNCPRCHGSGNVPINYAQGICFLCMGSGKTLFFK